MSAISTTSPLAKIACKTAIAASLSYILAQGLHWEYPFYAVIAAIIVMASTAGSTVTLSVQRLIGTAIGAISGAMFSITLGSNPWSLGISIFFNFFFTSYWKLPEAAKLASYVSAIVILNHSHTPWLYAWGRFQETLLGIGSALLVNTLIFPASADAELRRCLAQTLVDLEQLYQLVVDCAFAGTYDRPAANALKTSIIASLQKSRPLWKEVQQRRAGSGSKTLIAEAWEFLIHRLWEHTLTMEHTVLVRKRDRFWRLLAPQLMPLAQATQREMITLATEVKSQDRGRSLGDLETALVSATEQLNRLPELEQADYTLDDLLQFLTFFYTMEEVSRKLQKMADLLRE